MRENRHLIGFFLLTFLISWVMWLPAVLNSFGYNMPTFLLMIGMAANFGPSFAAIILLRVRCQGVWQTIKGLSRQPYEYLWLPVAVLLFPILTILTYVAGKVMLGDTGPQISVTFLQLVISIVPFLVTSGPLGEELGWRGYAMPGLLSSMTPFSASIVLGLLWSLWHLPLIFIEGTVHSSIPFWQYMLQNTVITFFYTWLYLRTRGNLLVMILLHTMGNMAASVTTIWYTDQGRYLSFSLNLMLVVVLLVAERHLFFSRVKTVSVE